MSEEYNFSHMCRAKVRPMKPTEIIRALKERRDNVQLNRKAWSRRNMSKFPQGFNLNQIEEQLDRLHEGLNSPQHLKMIKDISFVKFSLENERKLFRFNPQTIINIDFFEKIGPVINVDAKWDKKKHPFLKVKFRGINIFRNNFILSVANEWEEFTGIEFVESNWEDENTIIVSFDTEEGNKSELGTNHLDKESPTMNFSVFDTSKNYMVWRHIVLHEIGHVLGYHHAHQNPNFKITWNMKALQKDLKPPTWTLTKIKEGITQKHNEVEGRENMSADKASVMMYKLEERWSKEKIETPLNFKLSYGDKKTSKFDYS